MQPKILHLALLLGFTLCNAVNAGQILVGSGNDGNLYRIDLDTGQSRLITTINGPSIQGLAWDANNQILYGSRSSDGDVSEIVSIVPSTGQTALVAQLGVVTRSGGNSDLIGHITYNTSNDTLIGVSSWRKLGDALYSIDITSESATRIGDRVQRSNGSPFGWHGQKSIAFNSDNNVTYISSSPFGNFLAVAWAFGNVNTSNAMVEVVSSTPPPDDRPREAEGGVYAIRSMAYDSDLGLYALTSQSELRRIDPNTGIGTLLGSVDGDFGFGALASSITFVPEQFIPEPGSAILLSVASYFLIGMRRHC